VTDAAEAAVDLSDQLGGASVFPIEPGTKGGHYGRSWAKAASNDPETIRQRFAKAQEFNRKRGLQGDCNIGIACKPSGLVVVDIDDKGNKDGSATWAALTETINITTRTHTTPTGGRHVFFHSDVDLPNAVNWAPGLDLRASGGSHGGYVLVGEVDGSELGEGYEPGRRYAYSVDNDWPVAALPTTLYRVIEAQLNAAPGNHAETAHYSELVDRLHEMTDGDGRNNTFAAICGYLRNWIPHDDAYRATAWLIGSTAPHPLPEKELTATIRSLEKADRKEIAETIADVGDREPTWAAVTAEHMLDVFEGNVSTVEPDVLARSDGVHAMYTGETHIFFGEAAIGKSWVLMEACRQELMKGNGVVYFDPESSARVFTMRLRSLGLLDYVDQDGEVHPGAVAPAELAEICAFVRPETPVGVKPDGTIDGHHVIDDLYATIERVEPSLVVIDGLTNAFMAEGLQINAADEVGAYYKAFTEPIARTFGCAVAAIDHVTKDRERRAEALGSQHKTSGVTGAAYGVLGTPGQQRVGKNTAADLFMIGRKDRLGGAQDDMPMDAFGQPVWAIARLSPVKGKMAIRFDPFVVDQLEVIRRQNPHVAMAERLSDQLDEAVSVETALTRDDIFRRVQGQERYKKDGLDYLLGYGYAEQVGTRPARYVQLRPYRIHSDPLFEREPGLAG